MPLHFKPVLVAGCITGSACATGVPLTMHYLKAENHTQEEYDSLNLASSSNYYKSDFTRYSDSNFVTFNNFWAQMDKYYKENLGTLNKTDLPWRGSLRGLIDPFADTNATWSLQEQKWGNCKNETVGSESLCGYLYFREKNDEYKLRISYDGKEQWLLFLVKNEGHNVSFFSRKDSQWKTNYSIKFSDLDFFSEGSQGKWKEINEESIISKNGDKTIDFVIKNKPAQRRK